MTLQARSDRRLASSNWAAEVDRLRSTTDPDADAAVAAFRASHPEVTDLRDLVRGVIAAMAADQAAGDGPRGLLAAASDLTPRLPDWAGDTERLHRGQAVFNDNGLEMGMVLVFAGLPMGYAAVHGAEALARTSDLATHNLTRRIGETGQMLIDVMGTRDAGDLAPGGRAYATAVGLRLLHTCVRSLLADPTVDPLWPTNELGPPINQEMLLATLLDFTVVVWRGLERCGTVLSEEDRQAHLYTWSIVGHVMGVEACCNRPLELCDVEALQPLFGQLLGESEAGRRLMDALLRTYESYMPLGLRKLPRSLVHWLFAGAPDGVDRVPGMLGVQPAARWATALFALMQAAHDRRLLAPLRPWLRWFRRRVGRLVILAFSDGFAPDAPPFRIPDALAASWRLRRGPVAQRARAVRRRARSGTRRLLPQRPPVRLEGR